MKNILLFLLSCFFSACTTSSDPVLPNIVNVRLSGEPDQLNPILTTSAFTKQVEWQIFMPLLQFDANSMELKPVLAKSRPEVKKYNQGQAYTFEIRAEANWDDGNPVIAEDFIFSLKAMLHPEIGSAGVRNFLKFIEKVEVAESNPKKFTVYLNRPFNLAEVVLGTMAVYPQQHYDTQRGLTNYKLSQFFDSGEMEKAIAQDSIFQQFAQGFKKRGFSITEKNIDGCGPYEIQEWLPGERIVLNRKAHWWGNEIASGHQSFGNAPEQLNYHFITSDGTLTSLLKAQKIDVAAGIEPIVFETLQENELMQEQYNFYTPMTMSYSFIAFNTTQPRLRDKNTRRALSHLLNVEEIIRVAMNGFAVRTVGPIHPMKSYYDKNLSLISFDPEKTKSLLARAGWKDMDEDGLLDKKIDGVFSPFSLNYKYTSDNLIAEQVGLLLKEQARRVGVEVRLVPLEFSKLIEDTRNRDFDLYFSRWSQMPGLDDLSSIWHTRSDTPRGFNKTGFGNAITDSLIDSINNSSVPETRNRMYQKIQELIYEEQPYVFLFVPTERLVIHKRFKAKTSTLRPGYFENTFKYKIQ